MPFRGERYNLNTLMELISVGANSKLFPQKRKFTDILFAIIFLMSLALMIVLAVFGYIRGDLKKIAVPYDSSGNSCGSSATENYPLLYIPDPISLAAANNTVCVASCPVTDNAPLDCYPNNQFPTCASVLAQKSWEFSQRLCIPIIGTSPSGLVNTILKITYVQNSIVDIKKNWPLFLFSLGICLVLVVFVFFLVRLLAKTVVYLAIVGSIFLMVGMGLLCHFKYKNIIESSEGDSTRASNFRIASIVLWSISGVLALVSILLVRKIRDATSMTQVSARFIISKFSVVLIPVIIAAMTLVFLAWWIFTFLFIFSDATITYSAGNIFGSMNWSSQASAFIWCFVCCGVWTLSFLNASNEFAIAATACSWYFNRKRREDISVFRAFVWTWVFHLGTVALGSFLVALLWIFQIVLEYLYRSTKEVDWKNCLVTVVKAFCVCFERVLRYINQQTYTEVVLRNRGFCYALGKSFAVMSSNVLRFALLAGILNVFIFLIVIIVASLNTLICYFIWQSWEEKISHYASSTLAPMVVVFVLSFLISYIFASIFGTAADAMLHCYLFEKEKCGNIENGPQELQSLLPSS